MHSKEEKQTSLASEWQIHKRINGDLWIMWMKKEQQILFAPLYVIRFVYPRPQYHTKIERFYRKYPSPDAITYTGDRLKYYRYAKKLKQSEVAASAGIDRGTYRSYETNATYYPREKIEKIAQALDVDVYELLDDYNRFIYDGQGTRIKMIRKSFAMTQYEFAEYIGVTIWNVKQWEQERVHITKETFSMLMDISSHSK